jgi:putative oxidoreductase
VHVGQRLLMVAGIVTAIASLLHVAIIVGGPAWYRFFGAGERMARQAARGSIYAPGVTAVIAIVLAVWALYAFSGAGMIRPLPMLRVALVLIAAVFVGRGVLGIPLVLFVEHPYLHELRGRMTFMIVSSVICLALGLCYAVGTAQLWERGPRSG